MEISRPSSLSNLTTMIDCESIVVCVDFDDYLSITLPLNKRHFSRTIIVTSPMDLLTQKVAERNECPCHITDASYRRGAWFNKGASMEETFGLLRIDRWICIWDCDIVMPESLELPYSMESDCLYGPKRRLLLDQAKFHAPLSVDPSTLPCPTQDNEFAGYFQLFHGSLPRPWYTTTWKHAGGCDSDFQFRFPQEKLRRLPFDVIHLGPEGIPSKDTRVGANWAGRTTPRLDNGLLPDKAPFCHSAISQIIQDRKRFGTSKEHLG